MESVGDILQRHFCIFFEMLKGNEVFDLLLLQDIIQNHMINLVFDNHTSQICHQYRGALR